ncbi:glutathione S-transferase N-terminal domain-containing protein [Candidatus Acetothermia bacterium]|nr:glutathione S-transferase N-terminal domain-containing protein [Candidatus Acetothermia bacterium]MBI3643184.1 glutathione S-transferase N-terminal domain-containing protein [Candidatus Acetothermia bacterium]
MSQVTLYTTPTCTYCRVAKKYFEEHNVEYEEYDISQDMEKAKRVVEMTRQTAVPVIEVDGEFIIGFDKRKLASALGLD